MSIIGCLTLYLLHWQLHWRHKMRKKLQASVNDLAIEWADTQRMWNCSGGMPQKSQVSWGTLTSLQWNQMRFAKFSSCEMEHVSNSPERQSCNDLLASMSQHHAVRGSALVCTLPPSTLSTSRASHPHAAQRKFVWNLNLIYLGVCQIVSLSEIEVGVWI